MIAQIVRSSGDRSSTSIFRDGVNSARNALTALPFRADTTTYSNNGASMHCTTSLADVSAIAERLTTAPGIDPMGWVGDSLQRWIDGAPRVLIRAGQLNADTLRGERLTSDDVHAALRAAGCLHTHEVQQATIETNGQITVVLRNRDSQRAMDAES